MSARSIEISQTNAFRAGVVGFLGLLIALGVFGNALLELTNRWSRQEEYSHGFLIPLVTVWLLWTRRDALRASIQQPAWVAPIVILLAMAMHAVGELSAIFIFSQFGFIVALIGLILGIGGYSLIEDGIGSDLVFALRYSDALLRRFRNIVQTSANFVGTWKLFHQDVPNSGLSRRKCY